MPRSPQRSVNNHTLRHGPFVAFAAKPQAKLMFANNNYFKVALGIGITWACAFIFSYGLSHATLDREPLIYPTFQGTNLPFFITAPIAQSAFYILARKASWLLNIYIAASALCFAVFLFNLTTDGGYRFTYWHQGDYECVHGCDDAWIFGWLVFLQGCILMFTSPAFDHVSGLWRAALRVVLLAVLSLLFVTSLAIMISM